MKDFSIPETSAGGYLNKNKCFANCFSSENVIFLAKTGDTSGDVSKTCHNSATSCQKITH